MGISAKMQAVDHEGDHDFSNIDAALEVMIEMRSTGHPTAGGLHHPTAQFRGPSLKMETGQKTNGNIAETFGNNVETAGSTAATSLIWRKTESNFRKIQSRVDSNVSLRARMSACKY